MCDKIKEGENVGDEGLLRKHGELGSFVVRIQHKQNSSWQGRITWMEKDQTLCFRSAWELLKLIESAVETTKGPEDGEEEEPPWFDEKGGN